MVLPMGSKLYKKGQRNSLDESKTDTDGTGVLLHFECWKIETEWALFIFFSLSLVTLQSFRFPISVHKHSADDVYAPLPLAS